MTPPLTPYRNLGLMDISHLAPPYSQLQLTTTYSLESRVPAIFSEGSLIEINIQLVSVVVLGLTPECWAQCCNLSGSQSGRYIVLFIFLLKSSSALTVIYRPCCQVSLHHMILAVICMTQFWGNTQSMAGEREVGGGEGRPRGSIALSMFSIRVLIVSINQGRASHARRVCLAHMIVLCLGAGCWVLGGVMNVMNACIDCLRTRLD